MPHAPSDVSVSDSAAPNLLYSRFGAAESDTGNYCMHIRPHYNPIQTLNVYQNVIIEPHVPSDVSVPNLTLGIMLRCLSLSVRFSSAESDIEMFLYTYPAQLSPFNVL
jgi:hypothetical protein